MNKQKLYWIALNKVSGIGSVRFRGLLQAFPDVKGAWEANPAALKRAGLPPAVLENLLQLRATLDMATLDEELRRSGVTALTWEDEDYPRRLRELDQSPPVLYLRGKLTPEDEWAVAVVGTRRVSPYGKQVAEEVGLFLAQHGITVVSGLARGVDALAHRAVLKAGGRTLAVMAHGLDRVYPAEHRNLAGDIVGRGALISDYAIGTPPDSTNFPPRNRIISGLAIATIVVEAGVTSGALITAEFAADQGREVFAVPGTIFAPQSRGTNRLIQKGAHPLLEYEDLLMALDLEMMTQHRTARVVLPKDATEAKLFSVLSQEPLHVNEIGALAELPIDQVSSTLALMELKGLVRQVGGMNYVAVRELRREYLTNTGA